MYVLYVASYVGGCAPKMSLVRGKYADPLFIMAGHRQKLLTLHMVFLA